LKFQSIDQRSTLHECEEILLEEENNDDGDEIEVK